MDMGRDAEDIILQYTPTALSTCILENVPLYVPGSGSHVPGSGLSTTLELLDMRDEVPLVQIHSQDPGTCGSDPGTGNTHAHVPDNSNVNSNNDNSNGSSNSNSNSEDFNNAMDSTPNPISDPKTDPDPDPVPKINTNVLYTSCSNQDTYLWCWSPSLALLYRPGHYDLLYTYGQTDAEGRTDGGDSRVVAGMDGMLDVQYSMVILAKTGQDGTVTPISIPIRIQLETPLPVTMPVTSPTISPNPSPVQYELVDTPSPQSQSHSYLPPISQVISNLAVKTLNASKSLLGPLVNGVSDWIHPHSHNTNTNTNTMQSETQSELECNLKITMDSFDMVDHALGKYKPYVYIVCILYVYCI